MMFGVLVSPPAYRGILTHLSFKHFTSSILNNFIVILDISSAFAPISLS